MRIKTKTTGDWQTTTALGEPREPDNDETSFWVLVDIGTDPDRAPTFHVVPDWWMRNYIHWELQNHLRRHGGTRPNTPGSTHCAIKPADVAAWRGRWDTLGL